MTGKEKGKKRDPVDSYDVASTADELARYRRTRAQAIAEIRAMTPSQWTTASEVLEHVLAFGHAVSVGARAGLRARHAENRLFYVERDQAIRERAAELQARRRDLSLSAIAVLLRRELLHDDPPIDVSTTRLRVLLSRRDRVSRKLIA